MNTTSLVILAAFMLLNVSCSSKHRVAIKLTRADSISIIQAGLNDTNSVKEAKQYFGWQALKLVRYRVIQENYDLTFAGKKVEIVPEEYLDQMADSLPKRLVATVPMLEAISADTVQLSIVYYPGKATGLYTIVWDGSAWRIKGLVSGKM